MILQRRDATKTKIGPRGSPTMVHVSGWPVGSSSLLCDLLLRFRKFHLPGGFFREKSTQGDFSYCAGLWKNEPRIFKPRIFWPQGVGKCSMAHGMLSFVFRKKIGFVVKSWLKNWGFRWIFGFSWFLKNPPRFLKNPPSTLYHKLSDCV